MNYARLILVAGMLAALPLRAVYAPLPEQDQGKEWSASVRAGIYHDSNIFGARESNVPGYAPIGSMVYEVSPSFEYNGSLDERTFARLGYQLTVDHFVDRPGDKTLDSHDITAGIAHAFDAATSIDVSDRYEIAKNPEVLLAGITANTDQSYQLNNFDARFTTSPAPKFGLALHFRSLDYSYDSSQLANEIDRTENLYGISGSYDVVPEAKAVAEYRHEDVGYSTDGNLKNKQSNFFLAGVNYALAHKLVLAARLGEESRTRSSQPSASGAYAEFSAKYNYAQKSFLAAGFVRDFEETSNVTLYNDKRVNRLFVNIEHSVSALVVASASLTYEPSVLQGRGANPDRDETTTRLGLALTWLPTLHWAISVNYDYDNVDSDDPSRGLRRDRYGVSGGYTF